MTNNHVQYDDFVIITLDVRLFCLRRINAVLIIRHRKKEDDFGYLGATNSKQQ
jgi:hypothetical protein